MKSKGSAFMDALMQEMSSDLLEAANHEQMNEMASKLSLSEQECASLKARLEEAGNRFSELQKQLDEEKAECEECETECDSLESKLTEARVRISALESTLASERSERAKVETALKSQIDQAAKTEANLMEVIRKMETEESTEEVNGSESESVPMDCNIEVVRGGDNMIRTLKVKYAS